MGIRQTNTTNRICGPAVAIVLALAPSALSATFTIPASNATTENPQPGERFTGFLGTDAETSMVQIAGSELDAQGLDVGEAIIGVRARVNGGITGFPTGPTAPITWSDFTLKLSQATNSIATMSTTFASNMTSPVVVKTGSYTLPAGSMPGAGGSAPNPFGHLIQALTGIHPICIREDPSPCLPKLSKLPLA
jgi:hypothetical protein